MNARLCGHSTDCRVGLADSRFQLTLPCFAAELLSLRAQSLTFKMSSDAVKNGETREVTPSGEAHDAEALRVKSELGCGGEGGDESGRGEERQESLRVRKLIMSAGGHKEAVVRNDEECSGFQYLVCSESDRSHRLGEVATHL